MNTSQQRAALDALHALIAKCGSRKKTAEALGIGQGWLSTMVMGTKPVSRRVMVRLGVITAPPVSPSSKLVATAPLMLAKLRDIFGGMVCSCKLQPFVGGPVPCQTCQIGHVIAVAEGRAVPLTSPEGA